MWISSVSGPETHSSSAPPALKVSEKGGVSVYELDRSPVTIYKEQWTKLRALQPP